MAVKGRASSSYGSLNSKMIVTQGSIAKQSHNSNILNKSGVSAGPGVLMQD